MKLYWTLLFCCLTSAWSFAQPSDLSKDVWYHIFVRSFYDSNGDRHGDLKGITEKLDYLQELGITGLMLSPIQDADCYHNYFANDFYRIDPAYGTMEDFLSLRKETRKRKMRLVLDMEMQYVTDKHLWYKDSFENPASKYSKFLVYHDAKNTQPEGGVWGLSSFKDWQGQQIGMYSVNLNEPNVLQEMIRLFSFWTDPNRDGKADDGVDGFRIDHMMDDLDHKGLIKALYPKFWKPLIAQIKRKYPKTLFIGEQANWGFDPKMYRVAGADAQFGFVNWAAFKTLNKHRIIGAVDSTFAETPKGKFFLSFVENHDTNRSELGRNIKAAFTLLMGGLPVLYYGQELGMSGKKGNWGHDGNDIPLRQAFIWSDDLEDKGMAIWYKGTGPWWHTYADWPLKLWSYPTQYNDPGSSWRYYQRLIKLRKQHPVLFNGKLGWLKVANESVLAFERSNATETVRVLLNLGDEEAVFANPFPIQGEAANGLLNLKPFELQIKGMTLKP